MPKYIDVWAINWYDDLFMKGINNIGVWVRYKDVESLIRNAPAADVETVVRCRDCKFASMTYDGECKYCACFGSKDEYGELDPELYLPSDFFCAFGVRKEVDDAVSCN